MESRCKTGMVMPSNRSGGGVRLQFDGVQVFGYRGLLMVAVLFVMATTSGIEEVHGITTDADAPAPTPSTQTQIIAHFNQFEADALNAIFQLWTKQNPQLSTLLHWSLKQHPCDNLASVSEEFFEGAWLGVTCTSSVRNLTENTRHYDVSVTGLELYGSNESCTTDNDYQCGFDGIIGELPLEIGNLTNMYFININYNPGLTGPVPVELFRMPSLTALYLNDNSLSGTLPSDVYNTDCILQILDLSSNNFSGSLRVSSRGTLFCSSLMYMFLSNNSLSGMLPSDVYNADCQLEYIDLSFNNFSGSIRISSNGTFFCLFLYHLDLSMNHLRGSIDFGSLNETTMLDTLNVSNNDFNGMVAMGSYFNATTTMDLSNNQFKDITFHETEPPNGSVFLPLLEK